MPHFLQEKSFHMQVLFVFFRNYKCISISDVIKIFYSLLGPTLTALWYLSFFLFYIKLCDSSLMHVYFLILLSWGEVGAIKGFLLVLYIYHTHTHGYRLMLEKANSKKYVLYLEQDVVRSLDLHVHV